MNGVCIYLEGVRCLLQASVALWTMRQHSQVECALMCEHDVPDWWTGEAAIVHGCHVVRFDRNDYPRLYRKRQSVWCRKPFVVAELSPFQTTLSLDSDIIFMRDIPNETWERIASVGISTGTEPNEWIRRKRRSDIQNGFRVTFGLSPSTISKVAGCCVGYGTNPPMDEWLSAMIQIAKHHTIFREIPDEYALSYLVHTGRAHHMGRQCNCCDPSFQEPKNASIAHLGRNYFMSPKWIEKFHEAKQADVFRLAQICGSSTSFPRLWRKYARFSAQDSARKGY